MTARIPSRYCGECAYYRNMTGVCSVTMERKAAFASCDRWQCSVVNRDDEE